MAQVRTRKRGKTFSYIFEAGKTVDGKRKVVEKGGFPTKDAAYKAGVAAYNDYLHGNIGITSEKITLKDFMTTWLDNFVALNVKPTTLQKYQSHFKNQIVPYLGEMKVQELTPAMLDEWMRKLLQNGLSKGTLTNTHTDFLRLKIRSLSDTTYFVQSRRIYRTSEKRTEKYRQAHYHLVRTICRTP